MVSYSIWQRTKGEIYDHKITGIFSGSCKTFKYFKGGQGAFYQSAGFEQTDQSAGGGTGRFIVWPNKAFSETDPRWGSAVVRDKWTV